MFHTGWEPQNHANETKSINCTTLIKNISSQGVELLSGCLECISTYQRTIIKVITSKLTKDLLYDMELYSCLVYTHTTL